MATLPVITVASQEEMDALLRKWRWLLRERVVIQLGERPEVDELLDGFLRRMRNLEQPQRERALHWVMQRLREQCYRWREQFARAAGPPTDPVLGQLPKEVVEAIEDLPYAEREALQLAIEEGFTTQQIAGRLRRPVHAIAMRLYRARKRLKEQFPDQLGGALALAFWRPRQQGRRLVVWAQRRLDGLNGAMASVAEPCAQVALAAAVTFGTWGGSTTLVTAPALPALSTPTLPAVTGTPPALVSISAEHRQSPGTALRSVAAFGSAAPPPRARLLLDPAPGDETPDDTQFQTAAAAQNGGRVTVVALGYGRTCNCTVLFQSSDGASHWQAARVPAPADAVQVVLPPTYPADPRIFLGSNPAGGAATYVVPTFDQAALPLGPAGRLDLAARFDAGDSRAFVATQAGIVAIDVDHGGSPSLVMTYESGSAALVRAPSTSNAAALVLAPPGAMAVGQVGVPPTAAPAIFGCGASCTFQAAAAANSGQLTADPASTTVAMWGAQGVALSHDGGHSFSSLPTTGGTVGTVAVDGKRTWAIVVHGTTSSLMRLDGSGGWSEIRSPAPDLGHSVFLLAAPGGRLLDLLAGGGLRCTADGGATWADGCP